ADWTGQRLPLARLPLRGLMLMTACMSADSHVTEPAGTYVDRIDPKFRDRAPRMQYHETLGDVMLIDGGKSLVPYWLVAAAGRPAEEVRLDSGKRLEELWRGGWGPGRRARGQAPQRGPPGGLLPSAGRVRRPRAR